jgi:hypothetical protein
VGAAPATRLQTGLAQIQRRDPLHDQFDIVDFTANARFADNGSAVQPPASVTSRNPITNASLRV